MDISKKRPAIFSIAILLATAAARAADVDGAPTTGEKVNNFIDNLAATGVRLLELPLFMVLSVVVVLGGILLLIAWRMIKSNRRPQLARALLGLTIALMILASAYVVDRKVTLLQKQLSDITTKNTQARADLLQDVDNQLAAVRDEVARSQTTRAARPASPYATPTTTPAATQVAATPAHGVLMVDPDAVKKALSATFPDVTIKTMKSDAALNLFSLHTTAPLTQSFLAVVDLASPGAQVKLGATLDTKTFTSDFAKKNDCAIAINGEAGDSPNQGSGFGTWRGNLIIDGKVLLKENAMILRPFLSFDKNNLATFRAAANVNDRTVPSNAQNLIWGRLDAVIDGVVKTTDERNRQPRTAMGISKDGTKLFLLVADGRNQNYSVGFLRADVGQVLKAFGAANGMLCDEGGSSCMIVKPLGLINQPSDGEERFTYTHFGVALKE